MLGEWIGFRQATLARRTRHRLDKVVDRIHVLEGRQLVLLNIDEVIRIIRAADEPRPALIERFALSERQADDILEIRLRQLARLEAIRIEQELSELRAEQARLGEVLASPAVLRRLLVREIEADAKTHGDARRTLIQPEQRAQAELRVVDEPVTVVVSAKGWVRALKGHEVDPAALQFKTGDALLGVHRCRSVDPLIVFGSNGRVYSVAVSTLPGGRGDGAPITSLIELESGSRPLHYLAAAGATRLVLAGSGGCGLLAQVADLVTRQRGGKTFLSLEGDEQPLAPATLAQDEAAGLLLACLAQSGEHGGRLLLFPLDELKHQPKGGRGLTLIDLDAQDRLLAVACVSNQLVVHGTTLRGGKPKEEVLRGAALQAHLGRRARKGKAVEGLKAPRLLSLPA
jgi:topoisomerase-4 subunit A